MSKDRLLDFGDGVKDGLPIAIGYFPIAMAFGILSRGTGLSLTETVGFSLILFAGAAQFIAVSMIAAGASWLEIVITTLFLNFRHFLMSASISSKAKIDHFWLRPLISFYITDESFSMASFAKGVLTEKYLLPMQIIAYLGWASGTAVGFILGAILPPLLQHAMEIGLYVMFVALLVPEMKKSMRALVLALLAGGINSILRLVLGLPQGWSIILSIVLVAGMGLLIFDDSEEEGDGAEELNHLSSEVSVLKVDHNKEEVADFE